MRLRSEQGVVTVLFAIVLGLMLVIGALTITIGSWFTHARQLQTKADAAAFAGGTAWSFPCTPDADQGILRTAREYAGPHTAADGTVNAGGWNEQIGGVGADRIFLALNQAQWWDDGWGGGDLSDPPGSVCAAGALDVKVTEDDSPLLWGWLPFRPDIKRKARIQLEEAPGLNDILPIGVRVPRPVSSAAVFYNEANGEVLAVRFFDRKQSAPGLPAGLEGYSTLDDADASTWTEIDAPLPKRIGVAVALSFRPSCGTPDIEPPCFSGDFVGDRVDDLCNQGTGTQIVDCFFSTGNWPSQAIQSGLHFIRGYAEGSVGSGPPEIRAAYLSNVSCQGTGYFTSVPSGTCRARLSVDVDIGEVFEDPPGPPNEVINTRPGNVQVRYKLVRQDGVEYCDNFGSSCDLAAVASSGTIVTFSTPGDGSAADPLLTATKLGHAIAIEIKVRRSTVDPNPGNCGPGLNGYNDNCRWFHTGSGIFDPSNEPDDDDVLDDPVQRAFMGTLDHSGPVKWLQIQLDRNCDGNSDAQSAFDGRAATQWVGTDGCFAVDMGLKGGIARDQDEPPFTFNEGSGASQMGSIDCDPAVQQGQVLTDGVVNGCAPWYVQNTFDDEPLCPDSNQFFTLPKAEPFDDWPPYDCVKTRPTGSMNQLIDGLNLRIFGVRNNPQCPGEVDIDGDGSVDYTRGRNYWHRDNNVYDGANFAWDLDNGDPNDNLRNRLRLDDPRLVTLFFTPYDSFSGGGQEVFPIVALGAFYITGYGRLNGNGGFQGGGPEDPCSQGNDGILTNGNGNEPPPDLNESGGNTSGVAVWGHFIKLVIPASSVPTTSGDPCDPDESFQPCVPILVE